MGKIKFHRRRILLRLLALPFVLGLNVVFLGYVFFVQAYRFVMYGGEFITMTRVTDYATVADILNKLMEMNEKDTL